MFALLMLPRRRQSQSHLIKQLPRSAVSMMQFSWGFSNCDTKLYMWGKLEIRRCRDCLTYFHTCPKPKILSSKNYLLQHMNSLRWHLVKLKRLAYNTWTLYESVSTSRSENDSIYPQTNVTLHTTRVTKTNTGLIFYCQHSAVLIDANHKQFEACLWAPHFQHHTFHMRKSVLWTDG